MTYNPSSLVQRKGKWYVAVTKPKELQFGNDRQSRRSTGTTDRREAERQQHKLASEIYADFDRQLQRSDKVFEALRPTLEAEGINTRQWYTDGHVTVTLRGEQSRFSQITGAEPEVDGKPVRVVEEWTAENHYDLCWLVSILGHAVPASILGMLSDEDRAKVLLASKPSEPSTDATIEIADAFPRSIAKRSLDHLKTNPTIKLDQQVVIEGSTEPTLAMVIDEYLKSRPEASRKNDMKMLRKWLNHRFASKPLADVTHYDAYDFLYDFDELLAKGSIGVLKAAMSNVFKWSMRQRDMGIKFNPFTGMDMRDTRSDPQKRRN